MITIPGAPGELHTIHSRPILTSRLVLYKEGYLPTPERSLRDVLENLVKAHHKLVLPEIPKLGQ